MARKLDKAKPYGTILGDPDPTLRGACFVQDNIHFDSQGNEILAAEEQHEAEAEVKHRGRKVKEEAVANEQAAAAGDQVSSQLAQQ